MAVFGQPRARLPWLAVERHDDLIVYTDGSMFSKPRRQGGIGIRFVWADGNGEEQTDDYSPSGWVNARPRSATPAGGENHSPRRSPTPPPTSSRLAPGTRAVAIWKATTTRLLSR